MSVRWIVTGGAGFMGSNLALSLGRDEPVVLVDNFRHPGARVNAALLRERLGLEVLDLDVRDFDSVERLVQGNPEVETIVHLAGQVSFLRSLEDPRYDFETNALGTFHVLEAVRRHAPAARVIVASTNKVYGDLSGLAHVEGATRWTLPGYPAGLSEDLPLSLQGGYSVSKGTADQLALDYARTHGLAALPLRLSSVYGGHQHATVDQAWVAYFVRVGLAHQAFEICGDGKQVRDLLHVSDLIRLFRTLAETPLEHEVWGRPYNVGGGPDRSLSLLELFQRLEGDHGCRLRYVSGPPRPCDQRVFVADTSSLQEALGWAPSTSLDEGILELVEWTRGRVSR